MTNLPRRTTLYRLQTRGDGLGRSAAEKHQAPQRRSPGPCGDLSHLLPLRLRVLDFSLEGQGPARPDGGNSAPRACGRGLRLSAIVGNRRPPPGHPLAVRGDAPPPPRASPGVFWKKVENTTFPLSSRSSPQ